MTHFWTRHNTNGGTHRRVPLPVGNVAVPGVAAVGVQLIALLFLPRVSLATAVPMAVLAAALLFVAAIVRPRSQFQWAIVVGLYVSSVALAASTGPGLAGPVMLAATSPLLVFASPPWPASRRLLVDVATVMVLAVLFWLVTGGDGPGGEARPAGVVVAIQAAIALATVIAMRRPTGTLSQVPPLTARSVATIVAPMTVLAVALSVALTPHQSTLAATVLLIVPLILAVTARLLDPGRPGASRTVQTLVAALDHRHPDTSAHSARVYELVSRMLDDLPGLRPAERQAILTAALIHDIGKVGTPDQTLLKPGTLTGTERDIMRQHAEIGEQIVRRLDGLEETAPIVRHHHERWDGAGYPDGLVGPGIPFGARLIAVADTWDAMTHDRVYRRALGHHEALAELHQQRGRQFDPLIVDIFSRVIARERGGNRATSDRVAS